MSERDNQPAAKPNIRNVTGTFILLIGLGLYGFIVTAIGGLMAHWSLWLQTPFYLIMGIIWIFPAYRLLKWMVAGRHDP